MVLYESRNGSKNPYPATVKTARSKLHAGDAYDGRTRTGLGVRYWRLGVRYDDGPKVYGVNFNKNTNNVRHLPKRLDKFTEVHKAGLAKAYKAAWDQLEY